MAVVSARKDAAAKSRRDMYGSSTPFHDTRARAGSRHGLSSRDVSTAEVATSTDMSCAEATCTDVSTAATSAAVICGSIGGQRQTTKRENCRQRQD